MNIDQAKQEARAVTAFSEPIRLDGVTVIPAVSVARGKGPRGDGVAERPAGIFVVREGSVAWRPAVDVNRIILGGQLVFATALLVLRPLIAAFFRRRARRTWLRPVAGW